MASQLLGIKTKFTNDLGSPLAAGQVYTFYAGTSTPQDTYSNPELTIPNTNPIRLDDTGSADIFLKGAYRIRVFDASGRFIEEQDGLTQAASNVDSVASFADIRGRLDGAASINDMLSVANPTEGLRVFANGINGGWFNYDASKSTVNNGGTILNGWVRDLPSVTGWVTPQMFGAKADGVTFDTAALTKCFDFSIKNKKQVWMGGADKVYLVKHENPQNTFNYIFTVTENFNMQGDGATIKVDQSSLPNLSLAQYALFTIKRPAALLANYTYVVKDITFRGVNFEGSYVYGNDTDKLNLASKYKLRAIDWFEVRVNNLNIKDCEFFNFSQNNTIIGYFGGDFDTYGIGKGLYIDNCGFTNCGYDGDHSTIYAMSDSSEVTNCRFHLDKEYNTFGSHMVELHGDDSFVRSCTGNNYNGAVIFGTNTQNDRTYVINQTAHDNTFNVYAKAFSIWCGESLTEKAMDLITARDNTVTLLKMDGNRLAKGYVLDSTAMFDMPIVAKPLGTVSITGNTVVTFTEKPTYGVDIVMSAGGSPTLIDVDNNTFETVKAAVRVYAKDVQDVLYKAIKVNNNHLSHYADTGEFDLVLIDSQNIAGNTATSMLSIHNNTVFSYVGANTSILNIKSGYVYSLDIGGNITPDGSRGIILGGGNRPKFSISNRFGAENYLATPAAGLSSYSVAPEVLEFTVPLSGFDLVSGGFELKKSLGFVRSGVKIISASMLLSVGIETVDIPITAYIKVGDTNVIPQKVISNISPAFTYADSAGSFKVSDYSGQLISVSLTAASSVEIGKLKTSVLTAKISIKVERVL